MPPNDSPRDIELKSQTQPELFMVGFINAEVVATIMAGYEGHRGWLNYLAVAPGHQRKGIGRSMVEAAIGKLSELGCPKVNLQIRTTNFQVVEFYQLLGFTIDDVISMGKGSNGHIVQKGGNRSGSF